MVCLIVSRRQLQKMDSFLFTMVLVHPLLVLLYTVVHNLVFRIFLRLSTHTKKKSVQLALLQSLLLRRLQYPFQELSPIHLILFNVVFKLRHQNQRQKKCTLEWQIAVSFSGVVSYPFDTLQRRLQIEASKPEGEKMYNGMADCAKKILKAEGPG